MTRKRLLREMDSDEFSDWQEFFNDEPWGDERYHLALIAACIINGTYRGKDAEIVEPTRFLPPKRRKPKPQQTVGQFRDTTGQLLQILNPPAGFQP